MRTLGITLMLAGVATTALAQRIPEPARWWVPKPPAQYRMATVNTPLFVRPEAEVQATCMGGGTAAPGRGIRVAACSGASGVVLPDPCPYAERGERFAQLLCHELAHLGGWPKDHPL